jgi:hypothetical protein
MCSAPVAVAGMSAGIGRTLLFVFLVLAIIFVIVGFANRTVIARKHSRTTQLACGTPYFSVHQLCSLRLMRADRRASRVFVHNQVERRLRGYPFETFEDLAPAAARSPCTRCGRLLARRG